MPNRALVLRTALGLGDEIQKMLPVDLCAKYSVGGGRGNDDPVEIRVVVFRIPQNSLHSRIVVRHSVEVRTRASRDVRVDQRIAEKGASGPLRAADQIR